MTRRSFASSLLAAPAFLRAQSTLTKSAQRGQDLIHACIAALGGSRFLNMQDRLETGKAASFYHERVSGLSIAHLYTRYPAPSGPLPESYYGILEREAFGKKQEDIVLFTPDGGWEVTFRGVRPLPDESVAKHKETTLANFLYILRQRLHEPGMMFEDRGVDVADNQRVQRVDLTDNAGRVISVFLAAETNLPVSQRYMRFDPFYKEKIEEITRWSKYRDVGGGLMWPFAITRERDREIIYQMFSDKVSVEGNFAETLFTLPSGMKTLKKENF